jgi:pyruvate/2-oxoglutarate dehydrogenase complex dihydrolipoamide dehydrogenase (E3) component
MSKGVQFLMKKNKIDVLDGFGKPPGKKIDVTDKDNKVTEYSADHIIIATSTLTRVTKPTSRWYQSIRLSSSDDFTNTTKIDDYRRFWSN